MDVKFDCAVCTLNGVLNLFKKGLIEEKYQEEIFKKILEYYSTCDFSKLATQNMQQIKRIIEEVSGISDPYKPIKDIMTQKAIDYAKKYKEIILEDKNPLDKAMRFAIAGNIIDFGPTHNFDIEGKIKDVFTTKFPIDDSKELFEEIKKAKSIFYIADNTGEIIFDKLFLEIINHDNVTFCTRSKPILNDATQEDAIYAGIDKLAKIITTGNDTPGVVMGHCSQEFMQHFNNDDLIISKGQGNFEGMGEISDKNLFFLFTVKCPLISTAINVPIGKSIVKYAKKSNRFC